MNLGGVARTDRVLDEIGGRQECAAAADDEVLAALAAWADQIDDVPVAHARGRRRTPRGSRLHRILGGGAVVLATFSGASVAAALTGAQVPGMTSFGRAVVDLVPGDQLFGAELEATQGPASTTDDGSAGLVTFPAGTGTGSDDHERPGETGRTGEDAGPGTRAARSSAPEVSERGRSDVEAGPGTALVDRPTDGRVAEQTGPPAHAEQTGPPAHAEQTGPPAHAEQTGPPAHAEQTGPPAHAEQTGPPAHAEQTGPPAHAEQTGPPAHAEQTGPPAHAKKDQVPGQDKKQPREGSGDQVEEGN